MVLDHEAYLCWRQGEVQTLAEVASDDTVEVQLQQIALADWDVVQLGVMKPLQLESLDVVLLEQPLPLIVE